MNNFTHTSRVIRLSGSVGLEHKQSVLSSEKYQNIGPAINRLVAKGRPGLVFQSDSGQNSRFITKNIKTPISASN